MFSSNNTPHSIAQRLLLIALLTLTTLALKAQDENSRWVLHPLFAGENITACVDAGPCVYYLVSGNLYRYDKSSQENEHLSRSNYLSDSGVKNIYYNFEKKYLMVAYVNANIDIIDNDGSVTNMSDIKDASIATSKGINDVTFASDNRMVVATNFGYVIYNDERMEVETSLIIDSQVTSAAILANHIVLMLGDGRVATAGASRHVQQLNDFVVTQSGMAGRMVPIDDNSFFLLATDALSKVTVTGDGDGLTFGSTRLVEGLPLSVQPTAAGGYVASFAAMDYHYMIDEHGNSATREAGEGIYSCRESDGSKWALIADGLSHVTGETASQPIKPNAVSISTIPYWMTFDTAQDQLVLTSTSDNVVLPEANIGAKTQVNTYDGMTWRDVTPADVPQPDEGSYWPVISPNEAGTYYMSTRRKGVLKITDGKIVEHMTAASCGIVERMMGLRFDSQGNLWLVQTRDYDTPVRVLTPEKQRRGQTTARDFVTNSGGQLGNINHEGFKRTQFVIGAGDVKVFTNGQFENPIVMWSSKSDLSLDKSVSFPSGSLIDQDGKSLEWQEIRCLATDRNGLVWMGTLSGMIAFNPSQAFNADFKVNHIKVPRNDGTNLADYLLDGQTVNCIAVDGANRKWIGTNSSGLFLVSADGQTVLKNFKASNSVMGSDQIYQVCCDPNGNSVFVTTPLGVAEYKSDATPGAASYSNIYAYPNPVRPDYGGDISITGLMENSLVKIADPAGNVIRTLKSTGGMVGWDGCNENGDRVPTGVYTILASHADSSTGATTRVLIVR